MGWGEAGVILAVVSTGVLIVKEVYTTFWINRKKDKAALDVAKAQNPEIMRQLELGNFKAAAEGISIAQTFVADQLKFAQVELGRLRTREDDLETELADRDKKIRALESRCLKMEGKMEAMSEMLRNCQKQINRKAES